MTDRMDEWFQGWPVLKGGPGSGHHSHGGRPGQRGGSAATVESSGSAIRDYFTTGKGARIVPKGCGADFKEFVVSTFEKYNVPVSHLRGLGKVRNNLTASLKNEGFGVNEAGTISYPEKLGSIEAAGFYSGIRQSSYDPIGKSNYIVMSKAYEASEAVLMHELGHHVHNIFVGKRGRKLGSDLYDRNRKLDQIAYAMKGASPNALRRMGLRDYSRTNGAEFIADAYKVWMMGGQDAKANLAAFAKGHGLDLEKFFAP